MQVIREMKSVILFYMICGTLAVPLEDEALKGFIEGNHRFTSAAYKEILKQKSGNFIASPLSAEVILALTNEGARGDTSTELSTALSLPSSRESTRRALKSLLPDLNKSSGGVKLLSANKIYAANDLTLKYDFKSTAVDVYNADVENVDFLKPIEATAKINDWVAEKTNGKIKEILNSNTITNDTRLILVNAIYFNGKWLSKFDKHETKLKKFFKTKRDFVETKTMHKVDNFNYYENITLNAKFLELKYKDTDVSMVVVLPNQEEGLATLEENIEQVLSPQPFRRYRVDVDLPKFSTETELEFVSILKNLGVRKIFSVNADLTGLSSSHRDLAVSDIIQKAYIKVAESGTEAAAVTAVNAVMTFSLPVGPPPASYTFHADHPFLYFIKIKEVILFVGRYKVPK